VATFENLNERLSALGPAGVASTALGVAAEVEGLALGKGVDEAVGEDCAVGLELAHPVTTKATATRAARLRMLREV
jgi:hypothetical protein